MEGRPHRDGIDGRRRSLDSGEKSAENRSYLSPFKCAINLPTMNSNLEPRMPSPKAEFQNSVRRPLDYIKMVEDLQKENLSLKIRLYLLDRKLSQAGVTNLDLELNCSPDAKKDNYKDVIINEAIKTASAHEQKFLEAQSKVEKLESELLEKQELGNQVDDLQKVLQAKNEKIEELKNELKQMQNRIADHEESHQKAKHTIRALYFALNKLSKSSGDNQPIKPFPDMSPEKLELKDVICGTEFVDLADTEHPYSFKQELEKAKEHCKYLEDQLADKEKQLETKSSEISAHQKELEAQQNSFNSQIKSLSQTHESLSLKLKEKELLIKKLTEEITEMREASHKKDLQLQAAFEKRDSAEKKVVSVRRNLEASFEKTKPFESESLRMADTTLEEGSLPINSPGVEAREQLMNMKQQLHDVVSQRSFILSEYHVLQQHVEKLAHFMEKLISECSRLSFSENALISPGFLSEASECLDRTLQLSQTLAHDISDAEQGNFSRLTIGPIDNVTSHFESTRYSISTKCSAQNADGIATHQKGMMESSVFSSTFPPDFVVKTSQANIGRSRRRWSTSMNDKPTLNLEFSNFPDNSATESSGTEVGDKTFEAVDAISLDQSDQNVVDDQCFAANSRTCWEAIEQCPSEQSVNNHLLNASSKVDYNPLRENHLSSDSDIWSEPDRNLSTQRVGIQMEKPVPSPTQRRNSRTRSSGGERRASSDVLTSSGNYAKPKSLGNQSDTSNLLSISMQQSPVSNSEKYKLQEKVQQLQAKIVDYEAQISEYEKLWEMNKQNEKLTAQNFQLVKQVEDEQQRNKLLKENLDFLHHQTESCDSGNNANCTSGDDMCKALQEELQVVKGKLQNMYDKCTLYEKEVTDLKRKNEDLALQKESLEHSLRCSKRAGEDSIKKFHEVNALWKEEQQKCKDLLAENISLHQIVEQMKLDAKIQEFSASSKVENDLCDTNATAVVNDTVEKELEQDSKTGDCSSKSLDMIASDQMAEMPNNYYENEENSKIFLLKTQVSDLRRTLHKKIWKKDFFLVTKTVLIERLNAELKEKDDVIAKLTMEIENNRNIIEHLKLQSGKEDVQKCSADFEESCGSVQELHMSLRGCQEQIKKMIAENQNKNARYQELTAGLQDKENTIQKLALEIEEKDAVIQNFTEKIQKMQVLIEEKDTEMQNLGAQVRGHSGIVHSLTLKLEESDTTIKALNALIKDWENKTAILKNKSEVHEQREKLLKNEKEELVNSISKYAAESKGFQSQLLELKKQMEAREISLQNVQKQLCDLKDQLNAKNEELVHAEEKFCRMKLCKDECEEQIRLLKDQVGILADSSASTSNQTIKTCSTDIHQFISSLVKACTVEIKSEEVCNNLFDKIPKLCNLMEILWHQLEEKHLADKIVVNTEIISVMWDIISLVSLQKPDSKFFTAAAFNGGEQMVPGVNEMSEMNIKYQEKISDLEKQIDDLEKSLKCEKKATSSVEKEKCFLINQLKEKENYIQNLSKDKEMAESLLRKLMDQISLMKSKQLELEEKLSELRQELLSKESLIENLSNNESVLSCLGQGKSSDLDNVNLEKALAQLQEDFKSKQVVVDDLKQRLEKKDELFKQYKENGKEQSIELHRLRNALCECSKFSEQQSLDLKLQSKKISDYECELKMVCEELNRTRSDVKQKNCFIEELEADLKKNKIVIEQLQAKYESKVKELDSLNVKFHGIYTEFHQIKSKHTNLKETESQTVSQEVVSPVKNLSKLQLQLGEAKNLILSLKAANKNLEDENDILKKQLSDYNAMVKTFSEEKKVLFATIANLQKQLELKQYDANKLKLTELSNEVLFKESCIKHLNEDKQKLQHQVVKCECHLKELQAVLRSTEAELTTYQELCKEKESSVSELENKLARRSGELEQLKIVNHKHIDVISHLKTTNENSIKHIDLLNAELKKKAELILKLECKLNKSSDVINQLKNDLSFEKELIETLKTDMAEDIDHSPNVELNLKLNLDLIDDKGSLRSKFDESSHLQGTHQQNYAVLKPSKEKDVEKLPFTEESVQAYERSLECRVENSKSNASEKLMAKQEKTSHCTEKTVYGINPRLKDRVSEQNASEFDKPVRDCESNSYSVKEEMLSKWKARNWSLQKSILQLQTRLFEEAPLPVEQRSAFLDHLSSLHSKIIPISRNHIIGSDVIGPSSHSTETEKQLHILTLKADYDFLKNLRHLLKYFVIPLAKRAADTSFKPYVDVDKSLKDFDRMPQKSEEMYQSIFGLWNHQQSADPSEKIDKICGPDDPCFTLVKIPDPSRSVKHEQIYLDHNQSEPVSPRSNYSSPDLGIESDPNQDPAVHVPTQRGSAVGRSKDSLVGQQFYDGEEIWASTSPIHAIASLRDFELLRKEVEECLVRFKAITSRTKEGLKVLAGNASPKKLLEYSTLRGILDSCNNVDMCLSQIEKIVNNFWYAPYPTKQVKSKLLDLFQENLELKQSREKISAQLKENKLALKEIKLKEEAKSRNISRQLVETKKLLVQSKATLEQKLGKR